MSTRRTMEEIQDLLEGYSRRAGSRAEYCRRLGITDSTLDYYLRHYGAKGKRFARVKLTTPSTEPEGGFVLIVRSGRRIESGWNFRDADLARLMRIAEAE